jgi:signal transduction histidine kinase
VSAPRGAGRRLHRRVALLVGAGVVVPMAALAWVADAAVRSQSRELAAERQARAAAVAAGIDGRLQAILARLAAVASSPGFDLGDGDPAPERTALHAARFPFGRMVAGVFLTDAAGRVLAEDPAGAGPSPPAADLREALHTGRPAVSGLSAGPPPRAFLLVPFRDWRGQVAGLAGAAVDPTGGEWAPAPLRLAPADAPAAGAAEAPLSSAPWRVILPPGEAPAGAGLHRRLLALGPALLATALLFAWGAARSITRPLQVLGLAARRIAAGELTEPIPPLGQDEVGSLGRALEAMRAALAESLQALRGERGELERRVAERTRELAALYRRTVSVQEDERKRIARELHDETCQALVALMLRIEAAEALPAPEPLRERLAEARALAASMLEDLRRVIFDLRPAILDDLGLVPAIRWLAERQLQPLGVTVSCELEELDRRLAPEAETALFRAVQEALANVARHAGAEAVLLQLARRDGVVEIEIEDDGRGFDPVEVARPTPSGRGLGLMGIRERLELAGGRALIDSAPGRGTRVTLQAPLPEENDA